MTERIDWDKIREAHAANADTPAHWPKGVKPISSEGLSLLGIDQDNFLHWDGKRLKKEVHLSWVAKSVGWLVAGSTISMAVVDLLRFSNGL
ncbi:MAG: hypothetical protein QHC90_12180 [Shinella sp.]|nr:hypothetical protein [Shinella sp.]